jgi:hypothetical protein
LLGVCLSNLRPFGEQLSLFDQDERLHRMMDGIKRRYGYDALRIARGRGESAE